MNDELLEKENKRLTDKLERIRGLIHDEFDYTSFALCIKIKKILEEKNHIEQ